MSASDEIWILGIRMTKFGKHPDKDLVDIASEAALGALADGGVSIRDIQVLAAGNVMAVGFEKVYLMQNPLNLSTSEVINTYVYKIGLLNDDFSFSSAVGLFNSAVNFVLIVAVNLVARRISDTSLF